MSEECVFCKIAAGEIPSQEVVSTETTYAFRDLHPAAPTHVLVIPRKHIRSADQIGPQDGPVLLEMLQTAQEVAVKEGLSPEQEEGGNGYRLVFNVGEDAGNSVPHLHLHVLGGRKMSWPPG